MPEIQDLVTKAIQGYAETIPQFEESRLCILALAEQMAVYVIDDLKLEQEWAVGTFFGGQLDNISDEDVDPSPVMDALEAHELLDAQDARAGVLNETMRRALMTRINTGWAEEDDPEIDEHLVELVEAEESIPCVNGDPTYHNWKSREDGGYECPSCDSRITL